MSQDVEKLQKQLLEMMVVFRNFCEKNHLEMFLVGGSALGACRHQGFIPWDDDADLAMMRTDFEKMEALMKAQGNRLGDYVYSPVEAHVVPDAPVGYLYKIRECEEGYEILLKMDIHPIDGVPDGGLMRKVQMISALAYYLSIYRQPVKNKGKVIRQISKLILMITPKIVFDWYIKVFKKIFTSWNEKESKEICSLFGVAGYSTEVMPRNYLMPLKYVEFEKEQFLAPQKTHEYLSRLYGAYMELPPPKERKPHHVHQRVTVKTL